MIGNCGFVRKQLMSMQSFRYLKLILISGKSTKLVLPHPYPHLRKEIMAVKITSGIKVGVAQWVRALPTQE